LQTLKNKLDETIRKALCLPQPEEASSSTTSCEEPPKEEDVVSKQRGNVFGLKRTPSLAKAEERPAAPPKPTIEIPTRQNRRPASNVFGLRRTPSLIAEEEI